jgi:hypothetical protein
MARAFSTVPGSLVKREFLVSCGAALMSPSPWLPAAGLRTRFCRASRCPDRSRDRPFLRLRHRGSTRSPRSGRVLDVGRLTAGDAGCVPGNSALMASQDDAAALFHLTTGRPRNSVARVGRFELLACGRPLEPLDSVECAEALARTVRVPNLLRLDELAITCATTSTSLVAWGFRQAIDVERG